MDKTRKHQAVPISKMSSRSATGIFFKHTSDWENDLTPDFPHRDDYYMLAVMFDGKVNVTVDFKKITLCGGEGLILVPGQVHCPVSIETRPDAWRLFVSPEYVSEPARQLLEQYSLDTKPIVFDEDSRNDVKSLFEILGRHSDCAEVATPVVSAIVSLFCRSVTPARQPDCNRYAVLTMRLRHLLDLHLAEEKRPGAYASMLNISGVYLNEAVKAETGLSVSEFIRTQVVVNAKRELAHTDLNVSEVASALGYDDYSYFSRLFKKMTGVTPTAFRKNLR